MSWYAVNFEQILQPGAWLLSFPLPYGRFFHLRNTPENRWINRLIVSQIQLDNGLAVFYKEQTLNLNQLQELIQLEPPTCFPQRRLGVKVPQLRLASPADFPLEIALWEETYSPPSDGGESGNSSGGSIGSNLLMEVEFSYV